MLKIQFNDSPFKVIIAIYIVFILLFSFLYQLSVFTHNDLSFVDALFLSTSATSVTGLSTIDISQSLTVYGQALVLLQLEVGGIGIMAIVGSFLILFRKNVSLPSQTLMSFDQNQNSLKSVRKLMLFILSFAGIIQSFGFMFFFPILYKETGDLKHSLFVGAFHSVSSFTNGGFDLFGDSLIGYASHTPFVLVTAVLILSGVIGFPTVLELVFSRNKKKSLYTKINLWVHSSLLIFGTVIFFFFEFGKAFSDKGLFEKFLSAFFLSVTSRNGGLTTVDIGLLTPSTLLIIMLLMFIGGSASSCGGGIKTTTFAVIIAKIISVLKGQNDVVIFKKSVYEEDVTKAYLVIFLVFFLFFFSTVTLCLVEGIGFEKMGFEVMSAVTTTGLSTGITSSLSSFSKIWLVVLMIIGRIGVLSIIFGFLKSKKSHIRYKKEHVIVG